MRLKMPAQPRRSLVRFGAFLSALLIIPASGCAQFLASPPPRVASSPISIPLEVVRNAKYGTYLANVAVGIGNTPSRPFKFDTGSEGFHVYADADLTRPSSGVRCSNVPTQVIYGNPPRIIFSGVVCYAELHFQGVATNESVPIGYLTSASCPPTNPRCTIPDVHSVKSMGGYGIFGSGLTGIAYGRGDIPNPLLSLPNGLGERYSITLTTIGGQLTVGAAVSANAATFAFGKGIAPGQRYSLPSGCLFINGAVTTHRPLISFDTGNGVPWMHDTNFEGMPIENGYLKPGTRLGIGPLDMSAPATSVVAGTSFYNSIGAVIVDNRAPIANPGIQAFFDRTFTYDDRRGLIAVSP
jgi:hypothetical protein